MVTDEFAAVHAWVIAARPQTLPVGTAPVVVGTGLAAADGVFAPGPAAAALVGALLIQVGTNLVNDYHDAARGVDADSPGFTRVTEAGLLPPDRVRRGAVLAYLTAVIVGAYLVAVGGLPVVAIGLSAIAAGVLYTGGPCPYGYHGLGDLFVFLYFGLVAVSGTYYVQATAPATLSPPVGLPAGTITPAAVLAGAAAGGLATAVLVINNLRDMETDRAAGKQTLAVVLGARWSRVELAGLFGIAYLIPVVLCLGVGRSPAVLAVWLTLPVAADIVRTASASAAPDELNTTLERTGRLFAAYAVVFAAGVVAPEAGTATGRFLPLALGL
ncbi:MAG: 1,4-dihydroxy-2-naphthoate octaprenyltransferase [halophilic archaeon J07HX5]|jgi:1,4-dihydroxy-2-naphtoate prenyltransferase (EC 2.5.1.-)|nr:MAG: 1,4-dihydroxy-2-naphthoate octaprenyltransferase [halophilic archaeon J07HX5]